VIHGRNRSNNGPLILLDGNSVCTPQNSARPPESHRRILLRHRRANVPKVPAPRSAFQRSPAAALPQARARAGINVGEKILIRCATMVIEAQSTPLPCTLMLPERMIHRNVVDEPCAKIETGDRLSSPAKLMP